MQLNSLPIPRDDETLYSVAARTRFANAARDDRDACRSMFGNSMNMRVSDFPVNLLHFFEVTEGRIGDPQSILETLTLAGFFGRIGGHPWHAGRSNRPVEIAGYGLAALSHGNVRTWRVCPQCMESDKATYPTAYWRRSHQLPTSFYCATHDAPLINSLMPKNERHNRFFLPDDEAISDAAFNPIALPGNEKVQRRLTRMGLEILLAPQSSRDQAPVSPAIAHATIFRALAERGLLTLSGNLRREPFASDFSWRYGFLRTNPEFTAAVSENGVDILCRSLHSPNTWRSVAHRLLLIDWLFGSWSSFFLQYSWQRIMDSVDHAMMPPKIPDVGVGCLVDGKAHVVSVCQTHRAACLDFLGKNTKARRSVFARVAPRSFRWLLHNDTEWFDRHCPVFRREHIQSELF